MPLPLGTALSQPLLPATAASQLVQPQLSSLSTSNPIQNSFRHTVGGIPERTALSCTQPTSTSNIQSIMGLTPGPLQPPSTSNHLNISTNNSSHFSAIGGGNLNSLAVGGRSSANHPAGNT